MQRHLDESRTTKGVLDQSQLALRRERIARIGVEAGVERDVVVWRIKTRVIEQVEKVRLVLQRETFAHPSFFENREVHSRLKWTAEDVASTTGESVLNRIAKSLKARRGGAAERHAILSGRQLGNREGIRIQRRAHPWGPMLLSGLWRKARCQGHRWVGDE